ncbi:MAG: GGDEF domain-containing protein [Gammaproteobacteria bacterium]|nr:GGDEF domain-containing protein [Gammaproteobacteria bacterium]
MNDTDWKQKYLDSLDTQEHREQTWDATQSLLRQGLARMALAAEGLEPALDHDIQRLREAIRTNADNEQLADIVESLGDSVRKLDEARTPPEPTPAAPVEILKKKPGLLSRLFGRRDADVDTTDTAPPDSALLKDFCTSLLDSLGLPSELERQAEQLRMAVSQDLDTTNLGPTVAAFAGLISRMRGQMENESRELQEFLRQLTEHLRELDQNLSGAKNQHQTALDHGRRLDAEVQAQVEQIESTVEENLDPEQLKLNIQTHLSAIREHLQEFREGEGTRQQQLESQLEQLNHRVHNMEAEGEQLRQRLQQKHEQALHDPLTGLYNRLAYDERIAQEFIRWKRYQQPMALMMIDVDHFKAINDRYGHKAGDKALTLIAHQLRRHLRESDFLARFGGEEFVVLMPETELAAAQVAAEKLREAVQQCQFHYQGKQVPITVSAGLARLREDDDTIDPLFQRADRAMYRAKDAGRNRCISEDG